MTTPPLTTVRVAGDRAGAAAVRLLVDLVACKDVADACVELPTELVVRASTAPPPSLAPTP